MYNLNIAIIVGAIVVRLMLSAFQRDSGPKISSNCPNQLDINLMLINGSSTEGNKWNCYFDKSYYEMRNNFRNAVTDLGLNYHPYYLSNHKDISTDVSILDGNRSNIIIHISGTHGPEGFAGSAIQVMTDCTCMTNCWIYTVSICRLHF